jgi:hypothetical protein
MVKLQARLAQIDAEFETRRSRITKRRRRHLAKGRFLLDVCAETRAEIEALLMWRKKKHHLMHAIAAAPHLKMISAETFNRLRAYFETRGPAQHPLWIGALDLRINEMAD